MAFNLTKCKQCDCRFKVRRIKKPYIGMYKDNPVFHWHYECVNCGHLHTVRFYNEYVNTYFDKAQRLGFELSLHRKDHERYELLLVEYDNAKNGLDIACEDLQNGLKAMKKI